MEDVSNKKRPYSTLSTSPDVIDGTVNNLLANQDCFVRMKICRGGKIIPI
jgi:hypothetical protein